MQRCGVLVLMILLLSFCSILTLDSPGDVITAALCFCRTLPLTSSLVSGSTSIIHNLLSISTLLLCLCVTSSTEQAEPIDKRRTRGKEWSADLVDSSKENSLFIICIVMSAHRNQSLSWRCSIKKKHSRIILTSHVSALFNTACGFVGLRSWAYVYICIHVVVIHKIICLWIGGRKVLFVSDFCQGNIQSSFQQSLSTVQMVQPFPPSGVQLWDYGEDVWRKHCWNVFAFSSHLTGLFSSPWQMQCVSARLLFEI